MSAEFSPYADVVAAALRRSRWISTLLVLPFALGAAGMAWVTGDEFRYQHDFASYPAYAATVVTEGGKHYFAWTDPDGPQRLQFDSQDEGNYAVGDTLTLRIDPETGEIVVPGDEPEPYVPLVLTAVVAFGAVAAPVAGVRYRRRLRQAAASPQPQSVLLEPWDAGQIAKVQHAAVLLDDVPVGWVWLPRRHRAQVTDVTEVSAQGDVRRGYPIVVRFASGDGWATGPIRGRWFRAFNALKPAATENNPVIRFPAYSRSVRTITGVALPAALIAAWLLRIATSSGLLVLASVAAVIAVVGTTADRYMDARGGEATRHGLSVGRRRGRRMIRWPDVISIGPGSEGTDVVLADGRTVRLRYLTDTADMHAVEQLWHQGRPG